MAVIHLRGKTERNKRIQSQTGKQQTEAVPTVQFCGAIGAQLANTPPLKSSTPVIKSLLPDVLASEKL